MNDFTKDELLSLLKCVCLAEIDFGACADLDNLKFKLQSILAPDGHGFCYMKPITKEEFSEMYPSVENKDDCEHIPYKYNPGVASVPICTKCKRILW
jgi:hypothetical protein